MAENAPTPDEQADRRLRENTIGWFTSVRPSGQPDTVPIWYVWQDGVVVLYSQPGKLKMRNIAQNPKVSLALDDTGGGDDVVRLEGVARHVPDHPAPHEIPAFAEKYAAGIERLGYVSAEKFGEIFSEAIVITPTKFRAWA